MSYYLGAWYMAGWSADLRENPVSHIFLEQSVVLYRDATGVPVAIGGTCPHRFAPLGDGRVSGDIITCPYHGLQFDRTGSCVHNPNGEGHIPAGTRVASYPLVEKNGWFVSESYASVHGYLRVQANYQLVIDNLLDLTHAPYLHPETVGGDPQHSRGMKHEFRTDDMGVIHSNYLVEAMPVPPPQLLPFWGQQAGDFRAEMRWRPACTLDLDIRISPLGADKSEGVHVPSLHYLVPESETVTHYFFAMGRNVMLDIPQVSEAMFEGARRAFEDEDEPMIRKCQEAMGTTDLLSLKPVILQTDIAGVQARRLLAKLIRSQQSPVSHAGT
jgi:phenylpropionate dioxygenase-like ring-hydroxylating dioxygenase large terminal subunit